MRSGGEGGLLHGNLQTGEVRRTNIKNIFCFDIASTADGTVAYTVAPMTGKGAELARIIHDAAAQMGKTSSTQRQARGQVGHERGRKVEREGRHQKTWALNKHQSIAHMVNPSRRF